MMLQKPVEVRSPSGTVTKTWEDVEEIWCEVVPLEGRELYYAQQISSEAEARIRTRYRDDMTTEWHLVSDNGLDTYSIVKHPLDVNDRHTISIVYGKMLQPK